MNNKLYRIILSMILCFCVIVISASISNAADDEQIINASEVTSGDLNKRVGQSGYEYTVLNMDKDLTIDTISADNLTIKGTGKLTVKCMHIDNSLTIKTGANVEVINGHVKIGDTMWNSYGDYGLIVEQNATLKVTQDSTYYAEDKDDYSTDRFMEDCIFCSGHIKSSGNIILNSKYFSGIDCRGTITIEGGNFSVNCEGAYYTDKYYNEYNTHVKGIYTETSNFNVLSGNVSIVSDDSTLDVGNINIFGGNVFVKSNKSGNVLCTYSHTIKILGGRVEAESSVPSRNIVYARSIEIANGLSITTPIGGILKVPTDDFFDDGYSYITDANGEKISKVVIEASAASTNTGNGMSYSNEWINGRWYNADGSQTYSGTLSWKANSTGWWVEDSDGWYPVSSWQKIDGNWYYFNALGYMASNEYVDGYWLNGDGSCSNDYYLTWKSNSSGWWVEDVSGWWPSNKWLKIDSCWYYFDSSGYMVTNKYIDGYWIGANGVCQ